MVYSYGIDVGGTTVKGIIADGDGKIYAESAVATQPEKGGDGLCAAIAGLCASLSSECGITPDFCGVGCPGMVALTGEIIFAGNLNLRNYPLGENLQKLLGIPVKVVNDANAAALGEARFGGGKKYADSVFVTLGTGVGGGIIIGGKLFVGGSGAGAEIGHTVIMHGGEKCTCGRRGCFEAYASATALIANTRRAMQKNPSSKMWQIGSLSAVSGKTAFDFAPVDGAAKQVVDDYIYNLACGLINLANVFRPQVIILGGGVAAQGENLIAPLQKRLDARIFGGQSYAPVKIVGAELGNRAGALGASLLRFAL